MPEFEYRLKVNASTKEEADQVMSSFAETEGIITESVMGAGERGRRPNLARQLAPVIEDLIDRNQLTYNFETGETNIVIGCGYDKPMKVIGDSTFTAIEMPDGSAMFWNLSPEIPQRKS